MANKLRKVLDRSEWEMTIIDEEKNHYYQPGFLFIPFGIYTKQDVIKPKADFIPSGVKLVFSKMAFEMFKLKREDLSEHVIDVITVGKFYELAAGEGSHIIFT